MGALAFTVLYSRGHRKERECAVEKRDAGAEGDKCVHVRRVADEAAKSACKEFLVDKHDDRGEQQLRKADRNVIPLEKGRKGKAPHRMPHRDIHQNEQKAERAQKPSLQYRRLPVAQRFFLGGGGGGLFRPLARGAVTRGLDGGNDRLGGGAALDPHGVGQQTHRAGADAFHGRDGLFHTRAAGCAAHACYVILFHFALPFISSAFASSRQARRRPRPCPPADHV